MIGPLMILAGLGLFASLYPPDSKGGGYKAFVGGAGTFLLLGGLGVTFGG